MLELNKVYLGDCIELMKQIDSDSIDAIVSDPPYGLEFMGKDWDSFKDVKGNFGIKGQEGENDLKVKKGFEALPRFFKQDSLLFQSWTTQWAIEALRILKPGGFLFSMGGTRTYHRMTCGLEDAGFTIKDCIMWLYGSGFPKAQSLDKLIDKKLDNPLETFRVRTDGTSPSGLSPERGWHEHNMKQVYEEKRGTSDLAKLWSGWKTPALKPAYEPVVIAQKPCDGSITENVLKYGVGGFNVDECRIDYQNEDDKRIGTTVKIGYKEGKNKNYSNSSYYINYENQAYSLKGRFPANIILDEEAGRMLDEQSGISISSGGRIGTKDTGELSVFTKDNSGLVGNYTKGNPGLGDKGGASRFFYCPKASKGERNAGLEGFKEIDADNIDSQRGKATMHNICPYHHITNCWCGWKAGTRRNFHPTVKPIKLFEYLIKLCTTKDSIVLDPFLGSGTTAIACVNLGRRWIGIEKDAEYCKIAEARIKEYQNQSKLEIESKK